MASQPRKFSEKIALHNQKQAEGDLAFQQIMREVTDVTSNSTARNSKKLQRSSQPCGGGSLPNVNKISCDTNSPPSGSFLKPSRSNLEDMHCSRLESNTVYRERGRSVGSGGPMRSRPVEKRVDASPYSCGPYLSPPSADLSWRRTNSDSALHQSVQNPNNTLHSPGSQRRATALENQQHYDSTRTRHLSVSSDKRPRSCCEVPGIPDINIFPSVQDPDAVQIPIGNNTGSLPDLTNFQFSSPITPLDQDDHQSSTYSSASPQCTSPSTLSPTSLPPRTPGRFSFGSTPPHESSGPPSYSSISPPSPGTSKHLSVPLPGSGYLQSSKGYVLDGSPVESNSYQIPPQITQQQMHKQSQALSQQQQSQPPQMMHPSQQQQQQRQPQYQYQQTSSPQRQSPVSPVDVPFSESIVLNHRNSMTSYRSPQSNHRRSPQSSPILNIKQYSNNTSPLSSAPQSPTSSCNSITSNNQQQSYNNSTSDCYVTQAQETLQQHFEQIRMLDSPVSSTTDYNLIPIPNGPSSSYQQSDDLCNGPTELPIDQGYFSTSPTQLQYCTSMNNSQTTPNTPNVPEIVFTDCSISSDELMRRDQSKDLSCDFSNLFQPEESLDLDGQLQMFTQQLLDDPSQQHFTLNPL